MIISQFFFSPMKAMQRNVTSLLASQKGFITYVFCRNWAVRNPAGTRLDSSLVNKQVGNMVHLQFIKYPLERKLSNCNFPKRLALDELNLIEKASSRRL